MNLVFGLFDSTIDIWGHLGGLIGGALAGWAVAVPYGQERFTTRARITAGLFFIFVTVLLLFAGLRNFNLYQ